MKNVWLYLIAGLVFGGLSVCRSEDSKLNVTYAGKVSALKLPATALGQDWTGPTGLVVDDFQQALSKQPVEVKSEIEKLRKLFQPIGIVSVADFTYRKKSKPLSQITLRVFLFKNDAVCKSWWEKKYRYEGWEKHYTVVKGVPYDAVASTQITKRAVAFGNVWMTCGALDKTEDHIKLLELYINKIKNVVNQKRPAH